MESPEIYVVASEDPWPPINGVRRKLANLLEGLMCFARIRLAVLDDPHGPSEVAGLDVQYLGIGARPRLLSAKEDRNCERIVRKWLAQWDPCGTHANHSPTVSPIYHADTLAVGWATRRTARQLTAVGFRTVVSINDSLSHQLASEDAESPLQVAVRRSRVLAARVLERRVSSAYSFIDVVSWAEHDALISLQIRNARCIPIGVSDSPCVGEPLSASYQVGIMSSLSGRFGEDVQHFIEGPWRRVRQRYPKWRLLLVARHAAASPDFRQCVEQDDSIVWKDSVEDVCGHFLRECMVAVVPQRAALGISNKTLEAAGAGVPVVGLASAATVREASGAAWIHVARSLGEMDALLISVLLREMRETGAVRRTRRESFAWPNREQVGAKYLSDDAVPSKNGPLEARHNP